jgi:predicted permease
MMRRVFRVASKRSVDRDVDDEIAFHLAMRQEKLVARGLNDDDARAASLRQFGDVAAVRNYLTAIDKDRDDTMRRSNLLAEMTRDLGFAARTLRRNVVFTTIVVLTLAIGIGANTAIFTLVDAVLLRRLPVQDPRQLVAIGDPKRTSALSSGGANTNLISYPLYTDLVPRLHSFSGILASGRPGNLKVRVGNATAMPESPRARVVSANYFAVLGVRPALGRVFGATEEQGIGSLPAVVISHAYWHTRFNDDATVVGKTILLNGVRMTILGVARDGFDGEIVGQPIEMWIPLSMEPVIWPGDNFLTHRDVSWLLLLGRLAPHVTFEQSRTEVTQVMHDLLAAFPFGGATPEILRGLPIYLSDGSRGFSRVRATYEVPLFTLSIGVALLLLIICSNVANLMLARGVARTREIGVRLAIGAGRWRVVRQLLTESVVLGLVSAAAGLIVAWWGSKLLLVLAADGAEAIPLDVRLDLPVLAFTLVLSVLAVAVFGLAPAVRASRVDLATSMRASAASIASGQGRRGRRLPLGQIAIAAQVALSVVLLVGAGLLVQNLRGLENGNVGVDRDHLLLVDVDVPRDIHGERLASLVGNLTRAASSVPGVTAASYSENGLFSGRESNTTLEVPGFVAKSIADTSVFYDDVGPGYFHTIGAQILRGRDFTTSDNANAANVGVVNERMARFYWGGDAVGKSIHLADTIAVQIVGVVRDITDHRLGADTMPRIYLSYLQHPAGATDSPNIEIRTAGDPRLITGPMWAAIKAVDASLTVGRPQALGDMMRESIREQRLVTRLATGFGILAVLLAGIGLYGVMTYAVSRRTGEIGLRVALGAERGNLMAMILGDALRVVVVGLGVGIPAALAATRLLSSQLQGVRLADPIAVGAALTILLGCAVVAALIPAFRAANTPPLAALRQE